MNKFWIEEDEQYITMYINDGISKRIEKEKCTKEQQLYWVLNWLDEMNQFSSFIYGKFAPGREQEE